MEAPLAGDPVNERGGKMVKKMASMVGLSHVLFKNKN
jgi:hypothetical protein